MDPQSIDRIFWDAAQIASPEERQAYLDRACAGDTRLRHKVEKLLEVRAQAEEYLESPPQPLLATVDEPITERPGTVIGSYKLMEQIGEGGMGLVFVAEQQQPVRRKVALKVIKPGMDTRQVIARFEAERQALALMDHPNIARVLDGGTTGENDELGTMNDESENPCGSDSSFRVHRSSIRAGRPYFVMELVKGVPITEYCDQNQLPIRQRLELFGDVCAAVQHAHQKGIIHRDIKPSNVLVVSHDGTPLVKVIDFGIAKAIGQQLTDKTIYTQFAQLIGTPLYMSPEQAGQSGIDVDTRTDIYALGVLLYELLTGTTPFDKERLRDAAYDEIRRIIREEEPPKPSTRISTLGQAATTISTQRRSDPKRLSQLVRGELDLIVMKALEKDRNRRYETASAFAADVQRYLDDEPVQACPPSAGYRLRKFGRRNKRALTTTAVLGVAMVVTVGGVAWALGWANRDREARMAAVGQAATLALKEAERLGEQGKWPEALSAARRAEGLLAGGGDEALRERVRDWRRDVEMVLSLEDARLQSLGGPKDGKTFHYDAMEAAYRKAFCDYGIDVEALPADRAAELIRARPIAMELITALDHWAWYTLSQDAPNKLLAIARAADSDEWRTRVRKAYWAGQRSLARLAELAASAQVRALSPSHLCALGHALCEVGLTDDAVELLRNAQQRHPDDFWINFDLAWALTQKQPAPWDEVVRFYTAAMALRPGSPVVHNNLGGCLSEQGKPDHAIASCRRAVELDPQYAPAHNNLGIALYGQKKLDEAIAEFRKAIDLDPKLAHAHSGLGNALCDQGKLNEAIAEHRKAIELDPKFGTAHHNLGDALYRQKKLGEAVVEYRKAIALDPKVAAAHNDLGVTLREQGRLDDAAAEFRKAIALDPKSAMAHNNLGCTLDEQGKPDQAVPEYQEALRIKADYPEAHNNLGNALHHQGKVDEAVAEYKAAIRLEKDYPEPHMQIGKLLQQKGELDEAIAEFREALRIKPDYSQAHNSLGDCLWRKGQSDDASAEFREAVRLNKDNAEAHSNLGVALSHTGRQDQALAELKEAIRLKPQSAQPYVNLAVFLAIVADPKLRDPAEAVKLARKAVGLLPGNAESSQVLGWALCQSGACKESIGAFHKSMELQQNPKGGDSGQWFGLAVAHWRLQDKEEARKWYDKAVQWIEKNAPDNEELRRYRAEAEKVLGVNKKMK